MPLTALERCYARLPGMSHLPIDSELADLLELGERILGMATERGGKDFVAECVLRSGAELSARVRKGEPELVEEAGTRSAGLRVIQGKRVASTSTSDLTDAGIERFVADAIELVALSQEDPFAGPADPKLLCDPAQVADLDLYDPAGGAVDAARAESDGRRRPRRRRWPLTLGSPRTARARPSGAPAGGFRRPSLQRVSRDEQGLVPSR